MMPIERAKNVCPKTWSNLAPVPVHWEPLQWEEEAWTKTDWTSCPSPSFCVLSDRPIPTCVFVTLGDCSPQLLETKGELLWHDVARSSCDSPCVRHESKFTATRPHFATATVALLQLFQLFHIDKYEITQLEATVALYTFAVAPTKCDNRGKFNSTASNDVSGGSLSLVNFSMKDKLFCEECAHQKQGWQRWNLSMPSLPAAV